MQFNHPKEKQPSKMWFFVKNMADYVKNSVNVNSVVNKNKTTELQNLKKELLLTLTREDCLDAIANHGYAITYNPPGYGDFQFTPVTYLLEFIFHLQYLT